MKETSDQYYHLANGPKSHVLTLTENLVMTWIYSWIGVVCKYGSNPRGYYVYVLAAIWILAQYAYCAVQYCRSRGHKNQLNSVRILLYRHVVIGRYVTARIGFSVDSDLHEKSLRRIGSLDGAKTM
jgi:hypothetical protein